MSVNEMGSYLSSPSFKEAMGYFHAGRWEEGFSKLGEVERDYPIETDLRSIRQEMEIRSRISEYELEENRRKKSKMLTKLGLRILLALVVVGVAFMAIWTYSGWIQTQLAKGQSDFSQSMQEAELRIEFRNAGQLMAAGRSADAMAIYESIKAKNPDFPGLTDAITQAQSLKDVEGKYFQAMNLLNVGDSAQALSLLQEISQEMPDYRDVSLQIKSLQAQSDMTAIMQQADQAFTESRYEDAISGYESLRLMDPTFQTSHIEEFLFHSYVNAAQTLLASPVPSLTTLKKIDDYFSKALALRPMDREALAARTKVRNVIQDSMIGEYLNQAQAALAKAPDSLDAQQSAEQYLSMALTVRPDDPNLQEQFQIAQAYIQAINDFAGSKWDSVIKNLEYVIGQQASYASGTALQTLYDAYIAQGEDYIASGEYALALEDFQRAAVLAKQLPESSPLSFEAQIMIADAQGLLNHFQDAVLIYQDALNTVGLRDRIAGLNNSLTDTLVYAEYLSNLGNYQAAYYAYQKLIRNRVSAYNQTVVVTIKNGDYISMLAHKYNTTVAAILEANNKMNNQPRLTPDTQLIIPTLP